MDLLVYVVIAVVFLVSFVSLLFINSKLKNGKTFEEALAEKRQLADKLYGGKPKKQQQQPNRKLNKKNKDRKQANKDRKEQPQEQESQNDSDAGSDNSLSAASNNSPSHDNKGHVEFSEPEIIEEVVAVKKNSKKTQHQNRKTTKSSILVNKTEVAPATTIQPPVNQNNFEQTHPKDVVELKKQKEDVVETTKVAGNPKKDGKKGNKNKNPSPKIDKPTNVPIISAEPLTNTVIHEKEIAQHVTVVDLVPKDSPKITVNAAIPTVAASKEKQNKKKKNEQVHLSQQNQLRFLNNDEDVNVKSIITQLGKADLTRSEIQILIDYLLNKQQDTIVNHSDWSDDIVQKLKKQLAEKEKILAEEQEAAVGFQAKLREMRTEMNNERIQNQYKLSAYAEELNAKKLEVQNINQEIQFVSDKLKNENKALASQLQQLQAQLYQEKQLVSQESAQKMQQLTDANNALTKDNFTKNHMINELNEKFHQYQNETSNKLVEYEKRLQDYDIGVKQRDADIYRLRESVTRKDEYEKLCLMQSYDLEKLKAQVADQTSKTNHLDDSSKVEIRNLQNALDSSKTELQLCRSENTDSKELVKDLQQKISDYKIAIDQYNSKSVQQLKQVDELSSALSNYKTVVAEKDSKLEDYQTQLKQLTGKEDELFRQIAEYKDKNNELRTKNWKIIEALRRAESNYANILKSSQSNTNTNDNLDLKPVEKIVVDEKEQIRTKQILERLFPDCPAGPASYHQWIDHLANYVEEQQRDVVNNKLKQQQNNSATNNNSEINNKHNNIVKNNNSLSNDKITAMAAGETSAVTEDLILQNAKLQTTVDQYKTIVAETEGVLKNLELKVKEQDAYWRDVVDKKENEIRSINLNNSSATSLTTT